MRPCRRAFDRGRHCMITMTRSLARQLRAVFRRGLNLSSRGIMPAVRFCAGPDGLHVSCRHQQAAMEFRADGDHPTDELTVPFDVLADCEARRNDPVTLERQEKSHVIARWHDAGIPQLVEYDVPQEEGQAAFPAMPETYCMRYGRHRWQWRQRGLPGLVAHTQARIRPIARSTCVSGEQ